MLEKAALQEDDRMKFELARFIKRGGGETQEQHSDAEEISDDSDDDA